MMCNMKLREPLMHAAAAKKNDISTCPLAFCASYFYPLVTIIAEVTMRVSTMNASTWLQIFMFCLNGKLVGYMQLNTSI